MTFTRKLVWWIGGVLTCASWNALALGEADGQWFKLKFKTQNTIQIDKTQGTAEKVSTLGTCYTRLAYTPDLDPSLPGTYAGDLICQNTSGVYEPNGNALILIELPGGNLLYNTDDYALYGNLFGHVISGYANHQVFIKKDAAGKFQSAAFRSYGELVTSSLNPANSDLLLVGGYIVNGKSIPAKNLPFTPPS